MTVRGGGGGGTGALNDQQPIQYPVHFIDFTKGGLELRTGMGYGTQWRTGSALGQRRFNSPGYPGRTANVMCS
jgi:hypothetical protein